MLNALISPYPSPRVRVRFLFGVWCGCLDAHAHTHSSSSSRVVEPSHRHSQKRFTEMSRARMPWRQGAQRTALVVWMTPMCLGADGLTRVYMSYRTHSTHPQQRRKVNNRCLEAVYLNRFNNKKVLRHAIASAINIKPLAQLKIMTLTFNADTDSVSICKYFLMTEEENEVCV